MQYVNKYGFAILVNVLRKENQISDELFGLFEKKRAYAPLGHYCHGLFFSRLRACLAGHVEKTLSFGA